MDLLGLRREPQAASPRESRRGLSGSEADPFSSIVAGVPRGTKHQMPDLSEMTSKRRPMAQVWPLIAVAGLGLAVGIAAWIALSVWEERLAKAKFNDVAGDYATVLQNGLNAYLDKIRCAPLMTPLAESTPHEFDLFASQVLAWQRDAMRLVWCPQILAVNVSGVQLKNASELERGIEASLVRWNVDPGDIELELTESVLMEATQRHSLRLENLRQLGTKIAIDDFATATPRSNI
jgi:hypothetical protein